MNNIYFNHVILLNRILRIPKKKKWKVGKRDNYMYTYSNIPITRNDYSFVICILLANDSYAEQKVIRMRALLFLRHSL